MKDVNDPAYWEADYRNQDTPWDLGQAAPALTAWLPGHPGKKLRAINPGCGRGHDAFALGRAGYEVLAVDFAPTAVAAVRAAAKPGVTALETDLFTLSAEQVGTFDLWFEHTCFCAIDPAMRPRYVETARKLIKPDGLLLAVFFTHGDTGGPPFDVRPEEIERLFGPHFTVELSPIENSVKRRRGEETLGLLRPR